MVETRGQAAGSAAINTPAEANLTLRPPKTLDCTSCLQEKPRQDFPKQAPSKFCEHPVSTCLECMEIWIHLRVNESYQATGLVTCPECNEPLFMADIERLGESEDVHRVWYKWNRIIRSKNPDWRWCLDPDCDSGQKHVPTAAESTPEINIVVCKECNARACVTCDRPWHEGMNCSEYAETHMAQLVQEAFDKRVLDGMKHSGTIKLCPQCICPIEKFGLSEDVKCSRCLYTFFWDRT